MLLKFGWVNELWEVLGQDQTMTFVFKKCIEYEQLPACLLIINWTNITYNLISSKIIFICVKQNFNFETIVWTL